MLELPEIKRTLAEPATGESIAIEVTSGN